MLLRSGMGSNPSPSAARTGLLGTHVAKRQTQRTLITGLLVAEAVRGSSGRGCRLDGRRQVIQVQALVGQRARQHLLEEAVRRARSTER